MWIRVTGTDGRPVLVNMDRVNTVTQHDDNTVTKLTFGDEDVQIVNESLQDVENLMVKEEERLAKK